MNSFECLFQERAGRIRALSRLSQIALEGLSQISIDPASKFLPLFHSIAGHLPVHHQNHPSIDMPEYRVIGFLDGLTLIATISEVEAYFQDLVVEVLLKHPEKIGKSTVDLRNLLELGSIQSAVQFAAQRYASEMMFKRPNDYKKDLLSTISAEDTLLKKSWPVFVEAKARRDVGVHNGWLVNDLYRTKVREVGLVPTAESALCVDHPYLHAVRSGCLEIMNQLKAHCEKTFTYSNVMPHQ